jgi:hypothetical protein
VRDAPFVFSPPFNSAQAATASPEAEPRCELNNAWIVGVQHLPKRHAGDVRVMILELSMVERVEEVPANLQLQPPRCREYIARNAIICRHCHSPLPTQQARSYKRYSPSFSQLAKAMM